MPDIFILRTGQPPGLEIHPIMTAETTIIIIYIHSRGAYNNNNNNYYIPKEDSIIIFITAMRSI